MMYTQYTLSENVQTVVTYCCAKCRTINAFTSSTAIKQAYNTKGAITKSAQNTRAIKARAELKSRKKALEAKIKEEDKKGLYRHITLSHACEKCGHRPIWTKITKLCWLDVLSKLGQFALLMAACCVGLYMIENANADFHDKAHLLNFPIALLVIPLILKYTIRTVLERIIKKMNPVFLPRLCWNEEEFLRKTIDLKIEVQKLK